MAVTSDQEGLGKTYEYKPYVPEETDLKELTFKALFIGVIMAIILGSANAYLGLKAGITVAATFPAAVVGMAALRLFGGTILEENVSRTTGAVGEALAAGAIFTIPAFVIAGVWEQIRYVEATILMLVGGVLGAMFVILLRRILVEESGLPFPESVAAAEIHKAGQGGGTGAGYVFGAMGLSALIELFKNSKGLLAFANYQAFATLASEKGRLALYPDPQTGRGAAEVTIGGGWLFESPAASPALWGVGYIIGPRLASIAFSGGLLGWALFVPLVMMFAPDLLSAIGKPEVLAGAMSSTDGNQILYLATGIWTFVVRPFAVGAMLVGAAYTLWNMRKQLITGIGRAVTDLFKSGGQKEKLTRTQTDLPFGVIFGVIGILVILMAVIYYFFSQDIIAAITAAIVMTVAGFFFAAVAGYLVGLIGSSNNPISGLTLSTLILAAVLLVALGVPERLAQAYPEMGTFFAIAAVLGVASVICCACGVAGDMLQDLKVGHILGGTPWRMEIGKLTGVFFAALVMAVPLILLHEAYADTGGIGGTDLPAPQAGLMAMLSKGIIGGDMNWPLVILGMVFSIGLVLIKSPSPMLIAIGMYLPLHTTFAIFVGGLIRFVLDRTVNRRKVEGDHKTRLENVGILLASGLIAGEALMAIALAGFNFVEGFSLPKLVADPQAWPGIIPLALIAIILIWLPLRSVNRDSGSTKEETGA
ncbi:MAG TPA: oligopeptide transporter, OPT family [Acidobacteriota bacterium]|nr:oligopeptide transporter, OPT family [Acidobacteriota bacterium]